MLHQASTVLWHLATAIVFYANYLVEQNQSGKPERIMILWLTSWTKPCGTLLLPCAMLDMKVSNHTTSLITFVTGGGEGVWDANHTKWTQSNGWKTPLPTVLSQIVAIDEIFWRLVIHISSPFSFCTQY